MFNFTGIGNKPLGKKTQLILENKPPRKITPTEINPHFKIKFRRDNLFDCDSFISSSTCRLDMAMASEAWPNALCAQLFNSKLGVYFRGGFISYLK